MLNRALSIYSAIALALASHCSASFPAPAAETMPLRQAWAEQSSDTEMDTYVADSGCDTTRVQLDFVMEFAPNDLLPVDDTGQLDQNNVNNKAHEVFHNRDLVHCICHHLHLRDQRSLARTDKTLLRNVQRVYPVTAYPSALLHAFLYAVFHDSLEKIAVSDGLQTHLRRLIGHMQFADPDLNLSKKWDRYESYRLVIRSYLHEAYIRHPNSGLITSALKQDLTHAALRVGIEIPRATFIQWLWSLHTGYRRHPSLTYIATGALAAGLFGLGIYTTHQTSQFPDHAVVMECLVNIITNATIKYHIPSFSRPRGILEDPLLQPKTVGTGLTLLEIMISAGTVCSVLTYPLNAATRRVVFGRGQGIVPEIDFRPDASKDMIFQDLDDFLHMVYSNDAFHYTPSTHRLIYHARRVAKLLGRLGRNLNSYEHAKTQQLLDVMSAYKYSPTYYILGGSQLKDKLQGFTSEEAQDTTNFSDKLNVAFQSDVLLRYGVSAAIFYGLYCLYTADVFSYFKDCRLLTNVTQSLSYLEYMEQFAKSPGCCLTDTKYTNGYCPELGKIYETFSFSLVNTTLHNQLPWETKLFSIPLLILLLNLLYCFIG